MKFIPSREAIKAATKYITVGATVFAFGLVWNFPFEKIKDHLISRMSQNSAYRIDMETLSPAVPLGFVAKQANIKGPLFFGRILDLTFSSLRVTVSPLSPLTYLFSKSLTLWYKAEQDKTKWTGSIAFGKENSGFSLETKNWKVEQAIPMGEMNPMFAGSDLKVTGTLSVDTETRGKTAELMSQNLTNAVGNINMSIVNATIEPPLMKPLHFDKIQVEGSMEKGKMTIKSVKITGAEISGTISGIINVSPVFGTSQMDLAAKLTISPKMEELKTMITTFGSNIGLRLNEQGIMAFKLLGSINYPSIRPF